MTRFSSLVAIAAVATVTSDQTVSRLIIMVKE